MQIAPEILAEQVMGYVVWASELIPTLKPASKKTYSLAILPQGPHFYTGLLQAAGYLLLDSKKKKLIIVSQQSDNSKDILIDTTRYGPIFGQTWENSPTKIKSFARDIDAKLVQPGQKSLIEYINFQLPFVRTITESKALFHISLGEKISQRAIHRVATWMIANIQEYNIVLLSNIKLSKPAKSSKTDEQNKLAKIIKTYSPKTPLLTLFQEILSAQKKKSEIIAYVNPGDFGKNWPLTTRYVCAVG